MVVDFDLDGKRANFGNQFPRGEKKDATKRHGVLAKVKELKEKVTAKITERRSGKNNNETGN